MSKLVQKFKKKETPDDDWWYERFTPYVLEAGARLESKAWEYLKQDGGLRLHVFRMIPIANPRQGERWTFDRARTGYFFRTPLSQAKTSYTKFDSEMIEELYNYIDSLFKNMGQSTCQELVGFARSELGSLSGRLIAPKFKSSLREFRQRDHPESDFCVELSDQLAYCPKCYQRPILFHVTRDAHSMERHLYYHQQKSEEERQDHHRIEQKSEGERQEHHRIEQKSERECQEYHKIERALLSGEIARALLSRGIPADSNG